MRNKENGEQSRVKGLASPSSGKSGCVQLHGSSIGLFKTVPLKKLLAPWGWLGAEITLVNCFYPALAQCLACNRCSILISWMNKYLCIRVREPSRTVVLTHHYHVNRAKLEIKLWSPRNPQKIGLPFSQPLQVHW